MSLIPADKEARQKLFLGVLLIGGLVYGAYDYLYVPRIQVIAELTERVETLDTRNRAAKMSASGSDAERRAQLAAAKALLKQVEDLVPSEQDLPRLLDQIAEQATLSNVEIALIQPTGIRQEGSYQQHTYDLAVLGPYHDVGVFLTRIASLPRIVTPRGVQMTPAVEDSDPSDGQMLEARFSIETYVLPTTAPEPTPR